MTEAETVEAAKASLRSAALRKRQAIGSSARADAARRAAELFFDTVQPEKGKCVSVYWPIRDELDSKPLLIRLMDEGYVVGLPVVVGPEEPLIFRRWEDGMPLYPAGLGTLEPGADAPEVVPEIMVMPLLGFDREGTRLGYGGAYYDRTLAAMSPRPLIVGYAFAAQEVERIPREPHDVGLDILITEGGAKRFAGAA